MREMLHGAAGTGVLYEVGVSAGRRLHGAMLCPGAALPAQRSCLVPVRIHKTNSCLFSTSPGLSVWSVLKHGGERIFFARRG